MRARWVPIYIHAQCPRRIFLRYIRVRHKYILHQIRKRGSFAHRDRFGCSAGHFLERFVIPHLNIDRGWHASSRLLHLFHKFVHIVFVHIRIIPEMRFRVIQLPAKNKNRFTRFLFSPYSFRQPSFDLPRPFLLPLQKAFSALPTKHLEKTEKTRLTPFFLSCHVV